MGVHLMARSAALQFGRTAELRIDSSAGRIWVEVDTTSAGTGVRTTFGSVPDFSDGRVRLRATTTSVCYDGNGVDFREGCSGSGGFVFSKGDHTETVAISANGLVQ